MPRHSRCTAGQSVRRPQLGETRQRPESFSFCSLFPPSRDARRLAAASSAYTWRATVMNRLLGYKIHTRVMFERRRKSQVSIRNFGYRSAIGDARIQRICRVINQFRRGIVKLSRLPARARNVRQILPGEDYCMNFELTDAQEEIVRQVRTLCTNFPEPPQ